MVTPPADYTTILLTYIEYFIRRIYIIILIVSFGNLNLENPIFANKKGYYLEYPFIKIDFPKRILFTQLPMLKEGRKARRKINYFLESNRISFIINMPVTLRARKLVTGWLNQIPSNL